ncbi:hypothetical protein RHGRI_030852 [Rhododendron griersonianum]|uniref:CCHC-type domain-containing protein n=1 Tax=Rhododendron griersonianum TaxID=479676 RepID=A0AAV6I880_9ERIC|nr:hypothetical protein RHGRI_030852 [Rhododendron griersonianum]
MECQKKKFKAKLTRLKRFGTNEVIFQELELLNRKNWTFAYDGGHQYGSETTNSSESFNGVLKEARHLAVMATVMFTFYKSVEYFDARLVNSMEIKSKGNDFSLYAKEKYNHWKKSVVGHTIIVFDRAMGLYEVYTPMNPTRPYKVSLVPRLSAASTPVFQGVLGFADVSRVVATVASQSELSISHHSPAHRVTSVLLNGKNFAAWSRSFRLFLGGKGKSGWLLETEKQPSVNDPKRAQWDIDNCTILGWFFNSMEEHIYNMFMYYDTAPRLWASLTQMYAHARNDIRIYELYQEISHASQETLKLSVAEFFGYLQSRWEELAQYEPMSDFPADAASIMVKRLNRQHIYQFLMGLKKSEFENLRIQILNTSPMPSLYEVFATIDSEERRRRIVQPQGLLPTPDSSPMTDQMAFAASSSSRPPSGKIICYHCNESGHVKARCFKLHPELKQQFTRNRLSNYSSPSGPSRTAALAEKTGSFQSSL